MNHKNILYSIILLVLLSVTVAEKKSFSTQIEETTESLIAKMDLIDSEIKTSTEKPPIAIDDTYKQMAYAKKNNESKKNEENQEKADTQTHTVADFIIHPLIAFKARSPVDDSTVGKQVSTTTTPSPWTFFGINAGQGLGSLAGSLTGWLNDRIQLPGLVDTPVRESTTTSTTTTTLRPDVVVHVQHRGSTRRPLLSINNESGPNRFGNINNLNYDSGDFEQDYDDDDIGFQGNNFSDDRRRNNRRRQNQFSQNNYFVDNDYNNYNEDYDNSNNYYDDVDSDYDGYDLDDVNQEDNPRRKKITTDQDNEEEDDEVEETDDAPVDINDNDTGHEQSVEESSHEDHNDDETVDDDEEDENNEKLIKNRYSGRGHKTYSNRVRVSTVERPNKRKEEEDAEENSNEFYYAVAPSTKRSHSQINLLQQRQQNLINQIRQLTGVPSPDQIDTLMQKAHPQKHHQQATLFVNRKGQTIYMAPELLGSTTTKVVQPLTTSQIQYYPQMVITKNSNIKRFPQPPLTKPVKRKGRPTQYITIPWSKLGIAPPDQVVALAEGIQSEPHILNIPQSAVNIMSNPIQKTKRPIIAADAVPLLAEASLIDIFQPPKIPPSRSVPATSTTINKIIKPAMASGTHLLIATNLKGNDTTATILPHRIRGATIVEKAPAITPVGESNTSEETDLELSEQSQHDKNAEVRNTEKEFILVGQDEEPGFTRQVHPVYSDTRQINGDHKTFLKLQHRGNFALKKRGRALENSEQSGVIDNHSLTQKSVHVLNEDAMLKNSLKTKQLEFSTKETFTGISSATKLPVNNN